MILLPVRGLLSIYLIETFCQGGFYPFACVYGAVQELLFHIYYESIHVVMVTYSVSGPLWGGVGGRLEALR